MNQEIKKGKILSKREHVLQRPDMYIGSVKPRDEAKLVYSKELNKIILKEMKYSEGLERIFVEIMSNAIDNKWESEEIGVKMSRINITLTDNSCTVSNDGRWIPIEKTHFEVEDESNPEKTKTLTLYPPETYFGYMLSGTNYDDKQEKRKTSGKNGVGAKATNIYSTEFIVTCTDPNNKKKFVQRFTENMKNKESPLITSCPNKTGLTEITFFPDFKRFGFTNEEGWTEDFKALIHKHAFDCAMVTGLNVYFNGEKINVKNLQEYAKLYLEPDTNFMCFKSSDCEVVLAESAETTALKKGFQHVSFVNGIYTKKGGIHVDSWIANLLAPIRTLFNEEKSKTSKNDPKKIKVTLEQLKKYFFIFVKTELDKPDFESQSKHELTNPKPSLCKVDPKDVKKIMGWNFAFYIQEELRTIEDKKIARSDASSSRATGKNVDEANFAGGKFSKECILLITEGLSAMTFATAGKSSIEGGSDRIGTLAIRGKPINVSTNTVRKVNENNEIVLLKKMLGLRHGVDYSKDEEFNKLRYGSVGFLCDADTDGFHIMGLLMNYFYREFPALLDRGYVQPWNTPAVRVKNSHGVSVFYSHDEFKKWQVRQSPDYLKKCQIKYYKGLGSNTLADADDVFNDQKRLTFVKEDSEQEKFSMELGFNDKYAEERKQWLMNENEEVLELNKDKKFVKKNVEFIEGPICLKDFIDYKLKLYHSSNNDRVMPNLIDGLKEGQRKVLYTCLKTRLYGKKKVVKLVQIGGKVMDEALYHHGETSLYGTIVKMGQGYVGSNNIPLLVNDGQFGSRIHGGEDSAAPRYISTKLEDIARKIYRPEDDNILEYIVDEGKRIEPVNYVPIIPMLLVNGGKAVGSGFSTDVVQYNPLDLVEWIRTWIKHNEESCTFGNAGDNVSEGGSVKSSALHDFETYSDYPKLVPWWRGYTGTVTIEENDNGVQTVTTKGTLQKDAKGTYHIKELPIKLWTDKFEEYIETTFVKDKHIIRYNKFNTPNTVHFQLIPGKDFTPDIEHNMKRLVKSKKLSNMYALVDGLPKKFNNVIDIIEEFCRIRYDLYTERKKYYLKLMRMDLEREKNRYKFIHEVINGTLILSKRNEEDISKELEQKGYRKELKKINEVEEDEDDDIIEEPEEPEDADNEKDNGNKKRGGKTENKDDDGGYGYLLNMAIRSMTNERLEKLKILITNLFNKIKEYEAKSEGDLWKSELDDFVKAYAIFLKNRNDDSSGGKKKAKANAAEKLKNNAAVQSKAK
jgi:DNA topoisomerase-2